MFQTAVYRSFKIKTWLLHKITGHSISSISTTKMDLLSVSFIKLIPFTDLFSSTANTFEWLAAITLPWVVASSISLESFPSSSAHLDANFSTLRNTSGASLDFLPSQFNNSNDFYFYPSSPVVLFKKQCIYSTMDAEACTLTLMEWTYLLFE